MTARTIGQKIGQWLLNIKTLIALLVTVLPIIGGSVAYFQHDNIKNAVSDQKPEAVKPEIAQPVVENKVIETIAPAKNYDLIINKLIAENTELKKEVATNREYITRLNISLVETDNKVKALNNRVTKLKAWIGWKE